MYLVNNIFNIYVIVVKGSFEENSFIDFRFMFRFLNELFFFVIVCDFAKQWEEELFLVYLINFFLIKVFFLLEGWNNLKGLFVVVVVKVYIDIF